MTQHGRPHGLHPPLPQFPITCSMFLAFSQRPYTIHVRPRPIYSHCSGVGGIHTDVPALYTRPGCGSFSGCLNLQMPAQMHGNMLRMALRIVTVNCPPVTAHLGQQTATTPGHRPPRARSTNGETLLSEHC